MSYSMDSSTDTGKCRILIFDKSSSASPVYMTDYFFENEEIEAILDLNSNDLWFSAADLLRGLGVNKAKSVLFINLGKSDIVIDNRTALQFFRETARSYESRSGGDVVEYVDSINYGVGGMGTDGSEYIGDED